LRMAFAPAYVDGEVGFKQLLSPTTDVGIGFNGGAFGANYYEVRQGQYYQSESFYGNGGGASMCVYQLLVTVHDPILSEVTFGARRFKTASKDGLGFKGRRRGHWA